MEKGNGNVKSVAVILSIILAPFCCNSFPFFLKIIICGPPIVYKIWREYLIQNNDI